MIKDLGYATEVEEAFEGFACVAVAFQRFREDDGPYGVSVTMTITQWASADITSIATGLVELAAGLSASLT